MGKRMELHEELCEILGSKNVYFQPPEGFKLSYPCIVYEISDVEGKWANNFSYTLTDCYSITVIDKNPESDIHKKILRHFRMCSFDRLFISDNLYHKVIILYY